MIEIDPRRARRPRRQQAALRADDPRPDDRRRLGDRAGRGRAPAPRPRSQSQIDALGLATCCWSARRRRSAACARGGGASADPLTVADANALENRFTGARRQERLAGGQRQRRDAHLRRRRPTRRRRSSARRRRYRAARELHDRRGLVVHRARRSSSTPACSWSGPTVVSELFGGARSGRPDGPGQRHELPGHRRDRVEGIERHHQPGRRRDRAADRRAGHPHRLRRVNSDHRPGQVARPARRGPDRGHRTSSTSSIRPAPGSTTTSNFNVINQGSILQASSSTQQRVHHAARARSPRSRCWSAGSA